VPVKISLLHATYRRPGGPLGVKARWLAAADHPDSIEYLLAMDSDDEATVALTEGHDRVVSPPAGGAVTAVRNWNAAAAAATGDLLVVISDDLFPPPHWDTSLAGLIGNLDPLTTPFALKVSDSLGRDTLLRHPIVSRAFYRKNGLFSDSYTGVYCDDDLSLRAYWRAFIVDGRSLQFEHRHPSLFSTEESTESHRKVNAENEYAKGRAVFHREWNWVARTAPRRFIDARTLGTDPRMLWLVRAHNYFWSIRLLVRRHLGRALRRVGVRRR